ncbi:MAG: FAD/NAD(P)-binding protein [bacterium]
MINIYQPQKAKIVAVECLSPDTILWRLKFIDTKQQKNFAFIHGQFMQVGLPGWGECPISICSSPFEAKNYFELAIRDVGLLTHKFSNLIVGDEVDIRGPFGNGFDVEKAKDLPLIVIGGGCGFIPLRPIIVDYMAGRLDNTVMQIFYGCLNQHSILFKSEHDYWKKHSEFNLTLDKPEKDWKGDKGLITNLLAKRVITSNSIAIIVGPPVMYKFVVEQLQAKGIKDENIYVSLEKKMYCGVGVCQHCAIGPYYVCKDGPVFTWSEIKDYIKFN